MKYAIGIDMGGTKIEGAIIDANGKFITSRRTATEPQKGKKQVISNLVSVIRDLKDEAKLQGTQVDGVGVSLPGLIDDTGLIIWGGGTLTCLNGLHLSKELEKAAGLKADAMNDAKCFALAEATFGAARKKKISIGVIWGTGIGGGIIINRRVYSGAIGGAGEFGHMVIDPTITKGVVCGCGQRGCLEMLASGKNITRRYFQLGGKIRNAGVKEIYASKEKAAKQAINDAIHYLGIGLSTLVMVLNPEIIVLGGGVSKLPDPVYKRLERETKKYALPMLTRNLKIVRHEISDSAGMLGAAALVFNS
ncbi:MAG: ROK family protein [Candidatus Woesearchaeota archaeon]